VIKYGSCAMCTGLYSGFMSGRAWVRHTSSVGSREWLDAEGGFSTDAPMDNVSEVRWRPELLRDEAKHFVPMEPDVAA
jgi:hypothetical protein